MNPLLRNVPNLLTALRLASAPMLAALLVHGNYRWALVMFAFAGLSDAADGWLAKRYHLMTRVGRYLDPAADKVLMLASFLALTAMHATPIWLTAIVIGRDVVIVGAILLARYLYLPLRVAPLYIGKFSTAVQVGYVALMLFVLAFGFEWPRFAATAAFLTAVFTVVSGLSYAQVWIKAAMAKGRRVA
ncbi:MAG: CDP-alcohol phosphatidyltransferase family protein [Rhizomicrobium sp.]